MIHRSAAKTLNGIISYLFVPAGNKKLLHSALKRTMRAIIIDLEDAIPPSEKQAARNGLGGDVALLREGRALVCVRVNRPWTLMISDLTACVAAGVDVVMLPKMEGARDVAVAAEILDELAPGDGPVIISQIESARGLVSMAEIAATRIDRHAALMLGPEDLALDLGTQSSREVMTPFAQSLVVAAKTQGLAAIGSPGTIAEIRDMESYRSQLRAAKTMGFDAVAAIHPAQLEVIDGVFKPDIDEQNEALRIIAGDQQNNGRPFMLDGRMIDAPIVARARATIMRSNGTYE